MMQRLKTFPFYVFGIVIFFITHGYSEYTGLIPFPDLFILLGVLLLAGALLLWFFTMRLRSAAKAGLVVTLLLAFYLFYGVVQDALKNVSFLDVLARYRYIIPVFVIVAIGFYIYVKRSTSGFQRITLYLNAIFAIFIIFDLVVISINLSTADHKEKRETGNSKAGYRGQFDKKPDIYLVLLDEYSGTDLLKTYFNYDNRPFENVLRQQGFYVASTPACNYQSTVLSMASMFSMDYLKWVPEDAKRNETAADIGKAYKVISTSEVISILQENGYELHNYSFFDIGDHSSFFNADVLSVKLGLITNKLLSSCVEKDLLWHLRDVKSEEGNWLTRRMEARMKGIYKNVIESTNAAAASKTAHPKFVYAHLLMPHEPFLYDSTGKEVHVNMYNRTIPATLRSKAYLQYFVYTNKVVSGFIRGLLQKTNGEAVIILMSDHGYRGLVEHGRPVSAHNNFNAVYIPGKDYRLFYDSISNVNQFRVLFNTLYKTQLPLLPDIR